MDMDNDGYVYDPSGTAPPTAWPPAPPASSAAAGPPSTTASVTPADPPPHAGSMLLLWGLVGILFAVSVVAVWAAMRQRPGDLGDDE